MSARPQSSQKFLKDATATGSVPAGPVKMGYKVSHDFVKHKPSVALNGKVGSTTLATSVEGVTPVKATVSQALRAGAFSLNLEPAWLIKARTASVTAKSAYAVGKDKISAQASLRRSLSSYIGRRAQ